MGGGGGGGEWRERQAGRQAGRQADRDGPKIMILDIYGPIR